MLKLRVAVLLSALCALVALPARAETYDPVTIGAEEILQKAVAASGSLAPGAYIESGKRHVGGADYGELTAISGDDYLTTVQGGSFRNSYGRYKGQNWSRNENGIVTLLSGFRRNLPPNEVASSNFVAMKFTPKVLGMTQSEPRQYVVEVHPPGVIDEYLYFDAKTFLLARKVVDAKDRYRHVYEYGDYRTVYGEMVPFSVKWSDGRPENDNDATIISFQKSPNPSELTIPESQPLFDVAGQVPIDIPVTFTKGGMLVRVMVQGRGLDFLLDSGAAGLVIDPGVAHSLGLTPFGKSSVTIGGGDVDQGKARIPSMSIGPLQIPNAVFYTTPFDEQSRDARVVGLIGFDFFASAIVDVDFKAGKVRLYPRSAFDPNAMGLTAMPALLDDGVARVHASIEGVTGTFLVDTGASNTLLYQTYVSRLPSVRVVADRSIGLARNVSLGTAGGEMIAQELDVQEFIFGGIEFQHGKMMEPSTSTFDLFSTDGIIGRDALSVFSVYFDYGDGMVFVKQNV